MIRLSGITVEEVGTYWTRRFSFSIQHHEFNIVDLHSRNLSTRWTKLWTFHSISRYIHWLLRYSLYKHIHILLAIFQAFLGLKNRYRSYLNRRFVWHCLVWVWLFYGIIIGRLVEPVVELNRLHIRFLEIAKPPFYSENFEISEKDE